jgi:hypothetical protein
MQIRVEILPYPPLVAIKNAQLFENAEKSPRILFAFFSFLGLALKKDLCILPRC